MEGCSSDGSRSVNQISSWDPDEIDYVTPLFNEGVNWDVDNVWNQFIHWQSLNKAAAEMDTQIEHLQEENDRLNAENTCLKGQTGIFSSFSRLLTLYFQIHLKTIPKSINQLSKLRKQLSAFNTISNGDAAATISDIHMKLEADDESKVKFSDFTGLDGECKKVGKYSVPLSLHPIAKNIIDIHGDVSASGKMNPCASEPIYIMFCASVKEMTDLQLEQVTEDRLLKWRDAIKDALRINFRVEFAMERLKKIACAYIVLMEYIKLGNLALWMFKFRKVLEMFNDKHVSSGEQPIIDCESVTGGDDFDGGKKKQLTAGQDEFFEMISFEVENKLDVKRKLQLTMALERMIKKIMQQMKESRRDADVALHEKYKEIEMLKRKKRRLLAMEADKQKALDACMVFIEANEEKDTQNFSEEEMMNTLLTMINETGGVVETGADLYG